MSHSGPTNLAKPQKGDLPDPPIFGKNGGVPPPKIPDFGDFALFEVFTLFEVLPDL